MEGEEGEAEGEGAEGEAVEEVSRPDDIWCEPLSLRKITNGILAMVLLLGYMLLENDSESMSDRLTVYTRSREPCYQQSLRRESR